MDVQTSNGFNASTSNSAISATLRVTSVKPLALAVAARSPLMTGTGRTGFILPHCSATTVSTGRPRPLHPVLRPARQFQFRYIACYKRQTVGLGRRGKKPIDDRHRADWVHLAPLLGNDRIHGQTTIPEARHYVGEPPLKRFDSLSAHPRSSASPLHSVARPNPPIPRCAPERARAQTLVSKHAAHPARILSGLPADPQTPLGGSTDPKNEAAITQPGNSARGVCGIHSTETPRGTGGLARPARAFSTGCHDRGSVSAGPP